MRLAVLTAAALVAAPLAARAQTPAAPPGWTVTPTMSVHAKSRLVCSAAVAGFRLMQIGNKPDGDGACVYVAGCAMPPATGCAPDTGLLQVTLAGDFPKLVNDTRANMVAQNVKLNTGPFLGALYFASGDPTPANRVSAWGFAAGDLGGIFISGGYRVANAAGAEAFVTAFVDQAVKLAPLPPASTPVARPAAPPPAPLPPGQIRVLQTPVLVCPLEINGAKIIGGGGTYPRVKMGTPLPNEPEEYLFATYDCTYGVAGREWSRFSDKHKPNEWRMEVYASSDKAKAIANLKQLYTTGSSPGTNTPNIPAAKLGAEQFGYIQKYNYQGADPASFIDIYVGATKGGSTLIIRTQHYAETAAEVEAAVRFLLQQQPQ